MQTEDEVSSCGVLANHASGALSYNMVTIDPAIKLFRSDHTSEDFHRFFMYSEGTGKLYWAVDRGQCTKAGDLAEAKHIQGYLCVMVEGSSYLVHRVVWCMAYGEFPDGFIDHIDLDKSNNKLDNLRSATRAENNSNQRIRKDNTSGAKGICRKTNGWVARIQTRGRRVYVGKFPTFDEAVAAIREAREIKHKEFSNHG